MKENKEMTEQEFDGISGGPHYRDWYSTTRSVQYTDGFDKNGSGSAWKTDKPVYRPNSGIIGVLIGL